VLFGSWWWNGASYEQPPRTGAARVTTQGLSLTVTADETRLDAVLAAIEFAALAALVAP